jgi:hypothetical protein
MIHIQASNIVSHSAVSNLLMVPPSCFIPYRKDATPPSEMRLVIAPARELM